MKASKTDMDLIWCTNKVYFEITYYVGRAYRRAIQGRPILVRVNLRLIKEYYESL